MENQRPLILVSNDDGVIAKGISELVKFLRPLGEIVVMAPDAPSEPLFWMFLSQTIVAISLKMIVTV